MTTDDFIAQSRHAAEEIGKLTGWRVPAGYTTGPCGLHRDADPLDESNFSVALRSMLEACGMNQSDLTDLGRDEPSAPVHLAHFRHFACGWVDEIVFEIASPAARVAYEIAQRLDEDAMPLDEEDWCQRVWDADHPASDDLCYSRDADCPCGRERA